MSPCKNIEKLLEVLRICVESDLHEVFEYLEDNDHVVFDDLMDLALIQPDVHLRSLILQLHESDVESVRIVLVIQLLKGVDG